MKTPIPFTPRAPKRPLTNRERAARAELTAQRRPGGLMIDFGTPAPVVKAKKPKA